MKGGKSHEDTPRRAVPENPGCLPDNRIIAIFSQERVPGWDGSPCPVWADVLALPDGFAREILLAVVIPGQ